MNKSAKKLDILMIFLTFITVLFMPCSIVGGTLGINVQIPGQFDVVEALWPFYICCGIILTFMIVISVAFWKVKSSHSNVFN